jgi:hypothetical protein
MRRAVLLLALAALPLWRCGTTPTAPAAAGAASRPAARVPYDAPPAAGSSITITIDGRAASEILASLSRPHMEMPDVKILEDLAPVRLAIEDSGRPVEVFERDFAAAFDEQTRTAVFDFRSIRQARDRWQAVTSALIARREEIAGLASRRAASLLPADRAIPVRLPVFLLFGLSGLSDDLVVRRPGQEEAMIVDLSHALGETDGETLDSRASRLARLIAGVAFREAWDAYRAESPAWKTADASLAQLEPLLKAVAAAGPASLYAIDENFFPLATWLKEPMRRAVDDFNRHAERLFESRENLERRLEIAAEMRKPEFARRVAGPDGAFLADAVAQSAGIEGLRAALAGGPRAFFLAYDRATQSNKDLVPLAKAVRQQIGVLGKAPAKP